MSSETLFIIGLIGGAVFFVLFLIAGFAWWVGTRRAALSARMVQTTGTLQEIGARNVRRAKGASYWSIVSRYDYSVGGTSYTGTRAKLEFDNYATEALAKAAIGDKKAGQGVTVWYDPAAPDSATLDKTPPRNMGLYRNGAIISAIIAVVGLVLALTNIPGPPPGP